MQKLDFHNKHTNFYECKVFSERHNFSHFSFLVQAFEQNVLNESNKKFLLKFIKFLENKAACQKSIGLFLKSILIKIFYSTVTDLAKFLGLSIS